jgi:hypothetical protein
VKIGLIVDGIGEREALRKLLPRVRTPHVIVQDAVKAKLQPTAHVDINARAASEACRILARKGVERAVILLDFEDQPGCPVTVASDLGQAVRARVAQLRLSMEIAVVIKVAKLENWLIADLACLATMPRQFPNVSRVSGRVTPGNADGVDASAILDAACSRPGAYHKVKGAIAICTHLDPGRAALNSRSFRRLLRVLEDSRYLSQSRLPNREP